jgi:D-alanine-D-alanine ligase
LWDGLGCRGMARIDFMVTQDGAVFALEVNTTPGMSYESNFLTAAGLRGLGQAECCPVALQDEGEFAG